MLRLDAFKLLNKTVEDNPSFDIHLASLLVYNCFYYLNTIDDLALKESATNCIRLFLTKCSKGELSKSEKNFFEANFMAELKMGLRNKSENARHEFISVLVEFITVFKDVFTAYNDLCVLFDRQDVEKDFYENIKHIQVSWINYF